MFERRLLVPLLTGLMLVILTGCPDKKPKYPLCEGDKDCKGGQHCVNKRCLECGDDSHCPQGETCQDGACVVMEGACTSDEQCDPGQVCKDGRCSACVADGDCGPGGTCKPDGTCERPKACTVDDDCADDEDCIDGRCLKPWKGSGSDLPDCQLPTIYFAFDDSGIKPEDRDLLSATAECVRKGGSRGVNLSGFADESGTEEYNIALSERRARTVADYLARLGIDPAQFYVIPKGEAEPTGRGADADRRVEIQWK